MFHIYRDDKNMKLNKCGEKLRELHTCTSSALTQRPPPGPFWLWWKHHFQNLIKFYSVRRTKTATETINSSGGWVRSQIMWPVGSSLSIEPDLKCFQASSHLSKGAGRCADRCAGRRAGKCATCWRHAAGPALFCLWCWWIYTGLGGSCHLQHTEEEKTTWRGCEGAAWTSPHSRRDLQVRGQQVDESDDLRQSSKHSLTEIRAGGGRRRRRDRRRPSNRFV